MQSRLDFSYIGIKLFGRPLFGGTYLIFNFAMGGRPNPTIAAPLISIAGRKQTETPYRHHVKLKIIGWPRFVPKGSRIEVKGVNEDENINIYSILNNEH